MASVSHRKSLAAVAATLLLTAPALASLSPSQVLVVYNSASAEAVTLKNSYLAAHPTIPALNVVDLNNPALLVSDLTYTQFINNVRTPLRTYLATPGAGRPTPASIACIVLIRPFPHRIL